MTSPNTLDNWRPHSLVYFHCSLAILLLAAACSWGIVLFISRCFHPESAVRPAILGVGLFVIMLCLSLWRCSTPALPAFRGLLLITAYMTIGTGNFSLLFVIPAVTFAIVAIISITVVSLFGNDATYARKQFRNLVQFYRRHRMYQ